MRATPLASSAVLIALALLAAGCGGGSGGTDDGAATRTAEIRGGSVEVPADPKRIAVLWRPGVAAVTGLGEKPVAAIGDPGRDDLSLTPYLPKDYPVEDIKLVTNSPQEHDVNIEELAAAAPDLIIGADTTAGTQAELLPKLEEIAPTALIRWTGPTEWRDYITDVGAVLGEEKGAAKMLADYDDALAETKDAIGDPGDVSVSLLRLQSENEVRFETQASFPGEILRELGFTRPKSQRGDDVDQPFVPESYENLAEGDADMVFVFHNQEYKDAPTQFSDGLWRDLDAVRNKKIYSVDYEYWGSAGYYGAVRVLDDIRAAVDGELEPAV
ncbi:iron complex transport system substrate-binding protein [Murinocardiopsis flavida]|uniref:Iron complex transport system substrate-binding protein n=1 Tax=Murinocardiopsis flavida TaxID=645275 RepID=A0A2P8DSB2_9ACTN|nr:iron-siderophore ABC transporter substrate-binding protein [Murinocardiopsis flavida]PSL00098.1 iron complex transport system substrate-binding protein [Murinocardiopsis flavida]